MSDWKAERKIVSMPIAGADSPEVVLARSFEKAKAGHIKQVAVVIVWDDDSIDSDYSDGSISSLLYACEGLRIRVNGMMDRSSVDSDEIA